MRRRRWGTYYLLRGEWDPDTADAEMEVVDDLQKGPSHLEVAKDLWIAAGDPGRAERIHALIKQAHEVGTRLLPTHDVAKLLELIGYDCLLETLKREVLDERNLVLESKIDVLRQKTTMLELEEARGELARGAVIEGLSRVSELCYFLEKAIEQGLQLSLRS